MAAESAKQSTVEKIRGAPRDDTQLFRGVVAWPDDVGNWRRAKRETLPEPPARTVRRTIWESTSVALRILVDVVECASAEDAVAALIDRLEWNELANVVDGPDDLGVARFAHPSYAPPAIFFARANFCVSVVSFAREPAAVIQVAQRIDRRLASPAPPSTAGRLALRVEQRTTGRDFVPVVLEVPFPISEDGYERYVANGGRLSVQDEQVVVSPTGSTEVRVDAYVIERGRDPSAASLVIPPR
jgi:hypothetical protein